MPAGPRERRVTGEPPGLGAGMPAPGADRVAFGPKNPRRHRPKVALPQLDEDGAGRSCYNARGLEAFQ